MKRQYFIIVSIVLLGVMTACKHTQQVAQNDQRLLSSKSSLKKVIEVLQAHQPAFQSAIVKDLTMEVKLNSRKVNVKADVRMVTDSAIHLSIKPFMGIELFKMELTPETVIIVDRTSRRFYETSYAFFLRRFGVDIDFDAIQALISNRMFVLGYKAFKANDFEPINDCDTCHQFQISTTRALQTYKYNSQGRLKVVTIASPQKAYEMLTTYTNFSTFDKEIFPSKIEIEATEQKSSMKIVFLMNQIKFNEPLSLRATSTERYRRGRIDDFLKK